MSIEKTFGLYFKPEIQKNGHDLFLQDVVGLSIGSDTQVQAFVKAGTPSKVKFLATSISSPTFTAECTCSSAKKGQFCKHMWATLLAVAKKHPDFLDSKKEITIAEKSERPPSAGQIKQAEYKKQQYEKQKQRAKDIRLEKKKQKHKVIEIPQYPPHIEKALQYFSENGFPMDEQITEENLSIAKKKLSRVFHPDKGGSHDEITTLNKNYDCLISYITT